MRIYNVLDDFLNCQINDDKPKTLAEIPKHIKNLKALYNTYLRVKKAKTDKQLENIIINEIGSTEDLDAYRIRLDTQVE